MSVFDRANKGLKGNNVSDPDNKKSKQKTEQLNEEKNNNINENKNVNETEKFNSVENVLEKYNDKKSKEETFTRQTYLIRNDLIERFDELAKKKKRGFKTDVINTLLEDFLNKYE